MKRFLFLSALMLMGWCAQAANEIYAVLDKGTMTLYYDDQKVSRSGEDNWVIHWDESTKSSVEKVEFDYSFKSNGAKPTSLKSWFLNMYSLKEIVHIEYLNTEDVTDMSYMFYQCNDLTKLDLRTFNTGKVTDMKAMFSSCWKLESLDVSTWKTSNVKNMSFLFYSCSKLENLNLNSFETDNVTDMRSMFYNCNHLKSLFLTHWDVSKVVNMSYMFYGCSGLKSLNLASWYTVKAEDMTSMFHHCTGLKYLYINDFSSVSLTTTDKMFADCSGLLRIYCDGDFSGVGISTNMFTGCFNLSGYLGTEYDEDKIDGARAHKDGGEGDEGYFSAMPDFYAVLADDGVTLTFYYDYNKIDRGGFSDWKTAALQSSVTKVVIHSSVKGYPIYDMSGFFKDFIELRKVEGFNNFDCSNVLDMSKMFYNCPMLSEVDLSGTYAYKVMNMSGMFYDCSRLDDIDLSGFYTENVSDMSGLFSSCYSLQNLKLGAHFDTRNVVNFASMFNYCFSLTSFDLSGFDMSNAEDVNNMFSFCESLSHIELGHLDLKKVKDMAFMFSGCFALESVDLSNVETSDLQNMYGMFDGCSSLQSILFGSLFETYSVEDMSGMFLNCSSLTELHLDYFYTGNVKIFGDNISGGMFEGCSSLKFISMPYFSASSATSTSHMFAGCSELEHIYCYSDFNSASSLTNYADMFEGCYKLEGYKGTVFDDAKTDKEYARLDGGVGDEGYFSALPDFYAVMDGSTIVFYYDYKMSERGGEITWTMAPYQNAEKARFDESVKYYRPENISGLFSGFSKLTEIENFEYMNFEQTQDISSMFFGCSSLESMDLTFMNTGHVGNMSKLFEDCSSLKSVDMNGMNTSSVTWTYEMFNGCTALEEVGLRGWNTSQVMDMSGMFRNCSSLKWLDLSDFTIESLITVADIYSGGMFEGCSSLESIGWPVDFTKNATLMSSLTDDLFKGCDNLKGGHGTAFDPAVTNASYAHLDGGSGDEGYFSVYELYGVYDTETGTYLTVYYDGKKGERGGRSYFYYYGWAASAKTIEFDESVKNARLTSMHELFYCPDLEEIKHLEYLNTSMVTDMRFMFAYCESLKSLDLSSFDTRKVTNMSSMFESCYSLESLDLSSFDTKNVKYMYGMFSSCESLKSLDVSHFNTANMEDMSYMFYSCAALESLDLSSFDTKNVKNMNGMFDNCLKLESLDLSHFNTANVRSMSYMFAYCYNLESVDLSKFNTARVKDMSYMFAYCYSLKSLDLSSFETANVNNMEYMFSDCRSLKSLSIDHFSTDALENTFGMFANCTSLEKIYCSNDWTAAPVSSSSGMFFYCEKLTGGQGTVYDDNNYNNLSYAHPDGGTGDEGYFTEPGELYAVVAGNQMTLYYDDQRIARDGITAWQLPEIQGTVTEVVLDKSMAYATPSSTKEWFLDFTELTQITHLDYLNTNEVRTAESMFSGCEKLTELDLTSFTTHKLTNIQKMFFHCSALTTLYSCYSWDMDAIKESDGAFGGCTALVGGKGTIFDNAHINKDYARIDGGTGDEGYFTAQPTFYVTFNYEDKKLSFFYDEFIEKREGNLTWIAFNWNTEKVEFDESVKDYRPTSTVDWFYYFNSLKEIIHLDYLNTSEVTDMRWMFSDCQMLESLDLSSFDTRNVKDMSYMFAYCYNLESLDLSSFDTKNVKDMAGMFYACEKLESLDVSHFNTANVEDMNNMFYDCESLKSLDVSSFDTKNVKDMDCMFASCTALTAININNFDIDALKNANSMFSNCWSLERIYCNKDWSASTTLTSSSDMFSACDNLQGGNGTVYDAGKIDKSYARQDGGTGDEGYFTESKTFTVKFYNKAGEVAKTQEVETYNPAYAPEFAPLTGYTFMGWDKEFDHVMEDLDVHPIYEADKIDVIFYEKDGTTEIEKQVIDYEQHATAPAAPAAAEGYHFAGWLSSLTSEVMSPDEVNAAIVTEAVTYTAQYAINTYKVVFVAEHGTITSDPVVADMDKVEHGTELVLTATPDEGYDFDKWTNYDGTKLVVTSDTTVTAAFTIQKFTVSFYDSESNLIEEQTIEWGSDATAPEAPAVEGMHFTGWDKEFTNVKEDISVTAQYAVNTYKVTLVSENGSISVDPEETDLKAVEHGTELVLTATPDEGYDFDKWTNYDGTKLVVKSDTTVTALFKIQTFTVIFQDENGTELKKETVEWGKSATAPEDPTKEGWTFAGWDKAFNVVKSDLTVTATYTKNPVYTVTFIDYDESVIAEVKVEEGKDAVAPDDPIREGYHFTGWDKAFNNVTEDFTVTAQYEINTYTVVFQDYDGTELKSQTVEHGQDATAPDDPEREGYIFIGWDTDYTSVTKDLTVKAVYEKDLTPKNLKVTQEDKDGDQLITLSWDKVDGVPSYELSVFNGEDELFTENTFGKNVIETKLSELVKEYSIKPGTYTIHWSVRSTNIMGVAVSDWAEGDDFEITVKSPGPGTGVESIQPSAVSIQKVLREGVIYIEREGKTYDLNGRLIQ